MTHLTEEDRIAVTKYRSVYLADIIDEVANVTGVSRDEILGPSRLRPISRARQLVMYIAHREGVSLSQIGRVLHRDHTSILSGVRAEARRRSANV